MLKKIKQKISGSVLVFTLIILFIILATAIGIASVSVIERKTAGTTGKSTAGFQVADSGAEVILQKIYKDNSLTDLNSLAASLGTTCSNGTISGSISSGKNYAVTFYDDADPAVIVPCGNPISDVAKIKSVGTYAGTSRAIEVAVAQTGGGGCYVSYKADCSGNSCCISGFTNMGSAGQWGFCAGTGSGVGTGSHFRPPGGGCSSVFNSYNIGEAFVCCK